MTIRNKIIAACLSLLAMNANAQPQEELQRQESLTEDTTRTEVDTTLYVRVDTLVSVGNSMPNSFVHTKENKITRDTLLYPFFEKLMDRKTQARIVHIGDSHLRGHIWPVVLRHRLEEAWGAQAVEPDEIEYKTSALAKETGKPGLVYHAMGKNGATSYYYCDSTRIETIKSLKPDMIIVSFGTNEAHVRTYKKENHRKNLTELLTRLNEACPDATILLTTPPGAYYTTKIAHTKTVKNKKGKYIKKRYYTYNTTVNVNTPASVKTIKEIAQEQNLALWDQYEIVGGETNACTNWTKANLMKADKVHFTPNGYKVQGLLLGEALLKAYNRNIKKTKTE